MSPRVLVGALTGVVFGIGLVVGGMTMPDKVIDFLDLASGWDPSLAFVMGGAVAVHAVAYRLIMAQPGPVLGGTFYVPALSDIDARLVIGGGLFGVGWALGGYCPGPAIVGAGTGATAPVVFVVSMACGMYLWHFVDQRLTASSELPAAGEAGTPLASE